jgi:hypothetical protein
MSKLFTLNGIKPPGRVNLMKFGTINLEDLSDEQAIEVYKSGCPFLLPTPEAMPILYPDSAPIKVEDIVLEETETEPKPPKKKRGNK